MDVSVDLDEIDALIGEGSVEMRISLIASGRSTNATDHYR